MHAFKNLQGSRQPEIQHVIQVLVQWQRKKQIEIEIVYVNTKSNLADAPSRFLEYWEISANDRLLR